MKSVVIAVVVASAGAVASAQDIIAGVTDTNRVVTFSTTTPGTALSSLPITGLQAGDRVLGLDYRPQTGEVIAIGETSFLYSLNVSTGVATAIGTGFSPGLTNSPFVRYAIDINPTVDRVRVVGANAENRRLNPVNGAAVQADTALTYNPPVGLGLPPRAVATAYSNSVANAPVGSTRQFILDSLNNLLGEVGSQAGGNASFNAGVISSTLPIRLNGLTPIDFNDNAGFDISGTSNIAYVSLNLQANPANSPTGIYTLDLATGNATLLGNFASVEGGTVFGLRDITIIPAPGVVGVLGAAILVAARRRRS